ncbi:MAG: hypothetical protein QOE23_1251 [Pseudonocardiales bacterium]|jgi:hypothetical protein|nr:hypothetical protein [Pseudonocardiales bacterium]
MPDSTWFPRPMYLPPGYTFNHAREVRDREGKRSDPFILISYRSLHDAWWAVWTDKISLLGDFEGTRAEAIAWARERCDNIRICADPIDYTAPMVQLGPDDN